MCILHIVFYVFLSDPLVQARFHYHPNQDNAFAITQAPLGKPISHHITRIDHHNPLGTTYHNTYLHIYMYDYSILINMRIYIYMILWNKLPLSLRQHDLSHSCVTTDMARHKKGNFSVGCILLSKLSHLPYLMMHNVYAYHFFFSFI